MKQFIKFDINTIWILFLEEKLSGLDIDFHINNIGEIEINEVITPDKLNLLKEKLGPVGFEIIGNQKTVMVQKIKDAIIEMVFMDNSPFNFKSSVFLAEKLGHSYGYLSNVFSESTHNSIESFIILQKIERAKSLILKELSLTEIANLLNYSSVSHLSTQFKNTTGLTPSAFQRIIQKRRAKLISQ